jgi:putative FmdB family regulatory protein
MPTYEFRCGAGHDFEQFFRKISDAPMELPCPTCGQTAARRVSAGAGLHFKGAGFYITDYGKDGKKDLRARTAASESGGASDSTSRGAGESSGDSKGGGSTEKSEGSASTSAGKESSRTSDAAPGKGSASGGGGGGGGGGGSGDSGSSGGGTRDA